MLRWQMQRLYCVMFIRGTEIKFLSIKVEWILY